MVSLPPRHLPIYPLHDSDFLSQMFIRFLEECQLLYDLLFLAFKSGSISRLDNLLALFLENPFPIHVAIWHIAGHGPAVPVFDTCREATAVAPTTVASKSIVDELTAILGTGETAATTSREYQLSPLSGSDFVLHGETAAATSREYQLSLPSVS